MLETKVAKRYAKSLFDLAVERGDAEAVNNDMKLLASVCDSSRDLTMLLGNPIIHSDKKLAILKNVFGANIHPLSLSFFGIITKKGREANLPAIAKAYTAMYKDSKGVTTAIVTTAIGLDDTLRAEVNRVLRAHVKSDVELIEKTDKNLIGGFVLRIGDTQYDASVASTLRKLTRELSANPYHKN